MPGIMPAVSEGHQEKLLRACGEGGSNFAPGPGIMHGGLASK